MWYSVLFKSSINENDSNIIIHEWKKIQLEHFSNNLSLKNSNNSFFFYSFGDNIHYKIIIDFKSADMNAETRCGQKN